MDRKGIEVKILDCTLRDGGYYTNWDFNFNLVQTYFESFNRLPVEYLEIGYRSNPMKSYLGEYFYCPPHVLQRCKKSSNKKLVIILNEKDVRSNDAEALLKPCIGYIDMVRLAIDPQNFKRALGLAEAVKKIGFEVGFNVMYMSTWENQKEFLGQIKEVNGIADYFYMVDSFGGVYPQDVKKTFDIVRDQTDVKIGFHGHNNLQLGLINTLTAMDCGVSIVDATVTGMGRGAGNLRTELLLTALNAKNRLKDDLDFNALSKVVDPFSKLQMDYGWGSNLPYMVSGAHSLPQKEVMEWVTKRYYSLNSIIRALSNQSKGLKDNKELKKLDFENVKKHDSVMLIGGGPNAVCHSRAIKEFLLHHPEIAVVHASSKNARSFEEIPNEQFFCLVGNEGHRLEEVFDFKSKISGKCILPPYPRKMGTYIPNALNDCSYELGSVDFTDKFSDSHTAIALQTALELGAKEILMTGYDGYSGDIIGKKEQELFLENEFLFERFRKKYDVPLISITATLYEGLREDSVYSKIEEV
ncbi:aldolase catalytic domain-containing protein [Salinimicrobium sp. HB62]|uniref:aldolase catalytic domain-containing protein n=1 Tax=Salinimicrobium sp. HB62 TaxID=3077781 RepID=UPI002D78007C|nr:aldolase catalytic domain-containing protein [Salinimicrobium sp. HB62]